jgi:hypothetical protein
MSTDDNEVLAQQVPAGVALAAALGLTGWMAGEPPWGLSDAERDVDLDGAEAARCSDCRRRGLRVLRFYSPEEKLTLVLAQCQACKAVFRLWE